MAENDIHRRLTQVEIETRDHGEILGQIKVSIERITTLLEGFAKWEQDRNFLAEHRQAIKDIPSIRRTAERNALINKAVTFIAGAVVTAYLMGWIPNAPGAFQKQGVSRVGGEDVSETSRVSRPFSSSPGSTDSNQSGERRSGS